MYSEVEGKQAKRESSFIVVVDFKESRSTLLLGGRYRDLCEKRDDEWRILYRVCIWDWSQDLPTRSGWNLTKMPKVTNRGAYYPDDPIYKDWSSSEPNSYPRDDGFEFA